MKTEIELFFFVPKLSNVTVCQICENLFGKAKGGVSVFESTFINQKDGLTDIRDGYRLLVCDINEEEILSLIPILKQSFSIEKVFVRVKKIDEFEI